MTPTKSARYPQRRPPLSPLEFQRWSRLEMLTALRERRYGPEGPPRATVERPPSPRPGLFEGLRERKLVEWMLAYFALAWMALQMTDALREIWSWPVGLQRGITLALGFGVPPAAVLAWYHGERGRQKMCLCEIGLLAVLLAAAALVIWSVCS